ncbi:Peptidyl-prolyl cis-trans isomerase A2 [Gracilariopsis chorda]|uniref:Peptidyl-prolyl cis-trans isomerase n=1 Tax=Gracilariopsis chorda TaxID=448386 RepID=A0A2V3J7Q5_9FLOR|nr:Peptidyl-prolyl cis-trans isomerase A2 [Gracilariopsis chorda]|eukprot:PXF50042.1 Peptidyl-prolyl cis-trans isomerase A2 [Gracilariopsis chorda]
MGQSASKTKSKSNPLPRITATFPGDPDHGQVVMQSTAVPSKVARPRLVTKRLRCYLDVAIDGKPIGSIIIHLRPDIQPRTCENFRALCTGEHGFSYQHCKFHRIVPGFVLQSGDVELKTKPKEGRGGHSIYGRSFADENLHKLSHDQYGVISMANSGPHTNNSQFMIVVDPSGTDWLDGKHTVFGKVSKQSFPVLEAIEHCAEVFERGGKQRARIVSTCQITECGVL